MGSDGMEAWYIHAMKYEPIEQLVGETPYNPPWLIDEMIAQGTMLVVAGEAGIGKSTFMYALSMCVATGLPFLGHSTIRALVIYCDEENSLPDFTGYWQQIWHGLRCPDKQLLAQRLHFASFQLGFDEWLHRLRNAVEALPVPEPGLLVIDTATPALSIKDEDKNAEASIAIRSLQSLQVNRNLTIIILKHARIVEGESGADRYILRGAKAWLGGTGGTWFLTFAPGKPPENPLDRGRVLAPRKIRAFGLRKTIKIRAVSETVGDVKSLKILERF